MPTLPGDTTFAKPRPTPPIIAVPQSGPITSRSRAIAISFSKISSCTVTLSLKIITFISFSKASTASMKANSPGTEMSAIPAPCVRPRVLAGVKPESDDCSRLLRSCSSNASSTTSNAWERDSSLGASMAMIKSLGLVGGSTKPICIASSTLSGVAMATNAPLTPTPARWLTCINETESL